MGVEVFKQKIILYGCGDLINDYEGHPDYRSMRHHLGAMYFVDFDKASGEVKNLKILPVQRRRFRLEKPSRKHYDEAKRKNKEDPKKKKQPKSRLSAEAGLTSQFHY